MKLIDTHAHLDLAGWEPGGGEKLRAADDPEIDAILERARAAEVEKIVSVGSSLENSRLAVEIARKQAGVWATVGVHPDEGKGFDARILEKLRELARADKVVAIGEIGFDFGPHGKKEDEAKQEEVLRAQLELARELKLPAIIHTREADKQTLRVLRDFEDVALVVHCFQSGAEMQEAIFQNPRWRLSFTGLLTFPKGVEEIIEAAQRAPLEKIMLETDAPFLAPAPFRGKKNESAYLAAIARKLAEIKNVSLEEVAAQTSRNAEEFFGI